MRHPKWLPPPPVLLFSYITAPISHHFVPTRYNFYVNLYA